MKNKKAQSLIGMALLCFYFSFGAFLFLHYGANHGLYLWNHFVAILGIGLALCFNQRELLIASIALALPQECAWLVDHAGRMIGNYSLLGVTDYLFQPGLPCFEFLVNHYHLFFIPISLWALCTLKSPKQNQTFPFTFLLIFVLNALLFGASYAFFSRAANPNCVNVSCLTAFENVPLRWYPSLYFIGYTGISMALAYAVQWSLLRFAPTPRGLTKALLSFGILIALWLGRSYHLYSQSVHFSCKAPSVHDEVWMGCRYTTEYAPGIFRLAFTIKNQSAHPKECTLFIQHKQRRETIYQSVVMRPKKALDLTVTLPFPQGKEPVEVELASECQNRPY